MNKKYRNSVTIKEDTVIKNTTPQQQNNTQQKFKGTYTHIPFDMTQVDDYIGKWIRIYYNTNYGYTVLDSQILLH